MNFTQWIRGESQNSADVKSISFSLAALLCCIFVAMAFLAAIPVFQEIQAAPLNPEIPPVFWAPCEWLLLFSPIAWTVGFIIISPQNPTQG
ncbi:MAG TPA: hypothetical protein VKK79_07115 [Candidatus Lokiarchaeia archaeon]|nr:hypothetical protein [Candidatus Lokiarchaeia archaeon]